MLMSWTKIGYHLWCQDWNFGITTFAINHIPQKSEIVFLNCFSDWYFCFNKPFIPKVFELFLAQIRNIFDRFDYLFIKMIVLLLIAVKSSVLNGLTIKFSRNLFTSPTNLCRKAGISSWWFLYLNSSVDWVGLILSSKLLIILTILLPQSSHRSKADSSSLLRRHGPVNTLDDFIILF